MGTERQRLQGDRCFSLRYLPLPERNAILEHFNRSIGDGIASRRQGHANRQLIADRDAGVEGKRHLQHRVRRGRLS